MKIDVKLIGMMMLAFTFLCATVLPAQTPSKGSEKSKPEVSEKTPPLKGKTVNINKATADDLVKNVPLITPELAKKIVQYRKDHGDFEELDELLQIDGITRDLIKKIKPFLLLVGVGGKDCTC
jgi:competence protein ComEA